MACSPSPFAICARHAPSCFSLAIISASSRSTTSMRGQKLAFASEVKSLLQVPEIEAELDPESLHQYLTFLWVPDPRTMFRGIYKLPAGHCATFRDGELKIRQYWDLTFPPAGMPTTRDREDDLADEVRERFRYSVKQQMVSDVPIGAFLSAGLDSSSIVAMMCRATNQPHRTYTITFPHKYRVGETALDDPAVPARLARQVGLRESADRRRARCRGSSAPPHLAYGRAYRRSRNHHRIPGLPRGAQTGHCPALWRWRRRIVCRISQACRPALGACISKASPHVARRT